MSRDTLLKRMFEPLLVLLFITIVVVIAYSGIRKIEQDTRKSNVAALQTVLLTVNEALHLWVKDHKHDAVLYAGQPQVIELTEQLLTKPRDRNQLMVSTELSQLRTLLSVPIASSVYMGFFIIAPDGTNLASMRNENIGTTNLIFEQRPELFKQVLASRTVIVPAINSDVSLDDSIESIDPTMFVATPIQDDSGEVIAIFTLRIDPVDDFSKITALGRLGQTGETYAFNEDGYMMSESRFNNHLELIGLLDFGQSSILSIRVADPGGDLLADYHPHGSKDSWPLTFMAKRAIKGDFGLHSESYRDYRGVRVQGAWLWNRELSLGLASEIEEQEAMKQFDSARNVVVTIVIVTIISALFLLTYLVNIRARAVRELETAQRVLESRVQERTEDLFKINERLQEQVTERVRSEEKLLFTQKQLEESNLQLEDMVGKDGLTGVANRRAFDNHIEAEWRRCRRNQEHLSLILIDVDFFKAYNDNYGHIAGDECLKQVAQLLERSPFVRRPGDLVARYGGEEFGVILSGTREPPARAIAEELRQSIEKAQIPHAHTQLAGLRVLTVSAGVATEIPPANIDSPLALIQKADEALYAAKNAGRNRVVQAEGTPPLSQQQTT
ncbi:diguanylate cyclase [Corallincola platygyrae]|uniref:diguanylate cyclase n=1 Tax=Corallincola platygyrae TaxID=1193278 RepID=A0ABW4XIU9_9GAMM